MLPYHPQQAWARLVNEGNEEDGTIQSSTEFWFLQDKMDFEILVQALFNE